MASLDATAENRARRALAATSSNRDAMDAANAMLAAFTPHGGFEDASLLGGSAPAVMATDLDQRSDTGGRLNGHGPQAQAIDAVAHRVAHVDPKTVADAQAAAAVAAHDALSVSAEATSADPKSGAIGEETGPAAHVSIRSGGAGFHDDAFAHLETEAAAPPLQSGRLVGDSGADTLSSGEGVVVLFGGRGDDVLVSNGDGDRLVGGGGADTFVFQAFETSRVGVIENLGRGDVVDLSRAAAQFGLDHFTAVEAFGHHAGDVVASFDAAHDRTVFKFDVNGDGHADYRLVVDHGDYTDFGHFVDVDHSALAV